MPRSSSSTVAALVLAAAVPSQSFVHHESGPVAPIRLSPDGSRLFVADTVGGHLCVFDLRNPLAPVLLAEIPVGIEPVTVAPRTADEVWVANQVSDSVSIVSVVGGRVVETVRVKDEPSDIVFAGGKAFVSTATTDDVKVYDVATRALLGTVAVFGKDPRNLAVSPDGTKVYAVVQRSGNGTTLIGEAIAPLPPPPVNPALPAAPRQGIIVRANDPAWAAQIPFTLPDNDVAEIDVATLAVNRYFRNVGTTNTGIAVHPTTGDLWVANTDARNLVRFETALRGHAIDSRVARITTGTTPTVTNFDLNPGLDYNLLPNPAGLATALAEPFGVAIDAATDRIYVAAHGTDRIGVLDSAGNVLARIEIGTTPGATVDTRRKRGPRALALHSGAGLLYVLNRLSDTLAVVATATGAVLAEMPFATFDPMPPTIRAGRKFLYDAKLAGNGTMSCASCHIDGDMDGIAWDLGDPTGSMQAPPAQPFPFNLGVASFHPMKGPMTTQTLKGLAGTAPLHWRGDRADFQAFNGAFDTLLGGSQIPPMDMDDYATFANSIAYPPNPNQPLNRQYLTTPAANNQAAGAAAFQAPIASLPLIGAASCTTCHPLPSGTNRMVIAGQVLQEVQSIKVPQLRNVYRKGGFVRAPGPQKAGFGFTKDGNVDTLTSFLALSQFNSWPSSTKDDIATFLRAFDTGTAPLVGHQLTLTQANATTAATNADLALYTTRATAGDIDVIARGLIDGLPTGLRWQTTNSTWIADRAGAGPFTMAQLQAAAAAGTAMVTLTGVPPGTGNRLAIDRDLDGTPNGDEAAWAYGPATAGCAGTPTVVANSEPRVGNALFALRLEGAAPSAGGFFVQGLAATSMPIAGITLLVEPSTSAAVFLVADPQGTALWSQPLPPDTALTGLPLHSQVGWIDACGPQGVSSSRGLGLTLRP